MSPTDQAASILLLSAVKARDMLSRVTEPDVLYAALEQEIATQNRINVVKGCGSRLRALGFPEARPVASVADLDGALAVAESIGMETAGIREAVIDSPSLIAATIAEVEAEVRMLNEEEGEEESTETVETVQGPTETVETVEPVTEESTETVEIVEPVTEEPVESVESVKGPAETVEPATREPAEEPAKEPAEEVIVEEVDATDDKEARCPRCGGVAHGEDVAKMFGFRKMKTKKAGGGVKITLRRQSQCKKCRSIKKVEPVLAAAESA